MPTLADFERDYWAPDREAVLAQMRAEATPRDPYMGMPAPAPTYEDFQRDYWAPDREAVLASMAPPQQGGGWWSGPYQPGGGMQYGGGGGAFDETALSQAWLASGGRTPQDLARFLQQNPQLARGVTIIGSKGDKLRLPDGRTVDAVLSAGLGGRGAQWNVEGPGGGGGGGGGYGGGAGESRFERAPNLTPFNYPQFQRPGEFAAPDVFTYKPFEAPTGLDYMNDPGYQERLRLGTDALQRSAAAKGTLLTGGTLKDLSDYAQQFASNEYQNVYNRAFQGHQQNYNQAFQDWATNYQNQLGAYQTNWQNALDAYKTNFETQFQPWKEGYNQAYQSWLGNYNAANTQWQNEMMGQQQRYNQLFGAAQLGAQMTGQLGGYGQNYANQLSGILGGYGQQAGENITGAGNARAAGQVGSANAWGGALGNIGNAVNTSLLYGSLYNNQTPKPKTYAGTYAGDPSDYGWG